MRNAVRLLLLTLLFLAGAQELCASIPKTRVGNFFPLAAAPCPENALQVPELRLDNPLLYGESVSGDTFWTKFDPEGLSETWGWGSWVDYTGVGTIAHALFDVGAVPTENAIKLVNNLNAKAEANRNYLAGNTSDEEYLGQVNHLTRSSLVPAATLAVSVPGTTATGPAAGPAPIESAMVTRSVATQSRLVAMDADALVKGWQGGKMTSELSSVLQSGDKLVATPNVVKELRESVGVKDVDAFLKARGVGVSAADTTGAAIPATKLRQQLDQIKVSKGNQGDALNISEAGAINADLFVTGDKRATRTLTGGTSGTVDLPNSGGTKVPVHAIDDPATH